MIVRSMLFAALGAGLLVAAAAPATAAEWGHRGWHGGWHRGGYYWHGGWYAYPGYYGYAPYYYPPPVYYGPPAGTFAVPEVRLPIPSYPAFPVSREAVSGVFPALSLERRVFRLGLNRPAIEIQN